MGTPNSPSASPNTQPPEGAEPFSTRAKFRMLALASFVSSNPRIRIGISPIPANGRMSEKHHDPSTSRNSFRGVLRQAFANRPALDAFLLEKFSRSKIPARRGYVLASSINIQSGETMISSFRESERRTGVAQSAHSASHSFNACASSWLRTTQTF